MDPSRSRASDDDDLLTTMSHELRAPLNAILGWVQLLRAGEGCGAEADRALEIIERNARAEARAVDEAIDLARIAAGRMEIQKDDLRLVEALRAALASCEPAAHARRVRIDLRADSDARVRGDLGRLAQVARGLVEGAIRRSVMGGTIEVRLGREGSSIVLAVREDRGGGGEPTLPERGTARNRRIALIGDGRGMSIAVARGLVRLHGGTLDEEDDGEVMVVRLPVAAVARAPAERMAELR